MRDPQSSNVHILITRQSTGSGGREYTLSFMGRGKYEGRDSLLKYYSKSTDTPDQIRKSYVNVMKQGLIPYLYDTPLSEFITVSYAQKTPRQMAPAEDKWNYWVFFASFRGNLNFEEQSKRYSYSLSLSANRTTEATKFRFWANVNFNERCYKISEDEEVLSRTARKTVWTQLALPIRDASVEEILLELRRLATSYDLRLQMGFSYWFGSIYSNVVNPRFGSR